MKTLSLDIFELSMLANEVYFDLKKQWKIEGHDLRNTAKFVGDANEAMFLIQFFTKLRTLQSQLKTEYVVCEDYTKNLSDFTASLSPNDVELSELKNVARRIQQRFLCLRGNSFGEFVEKLYEKIVGSCENRRCKLTLVC